MTLTANGIDLTQPPQGVATTAAVRANFQAIDTVLTNLTASLAAGVTLAPVLSAIAALPAAQLGTIEKTGSSTVGTYTVTAFTKGLLSSTTASAWQGGLGLGTAATQASTAFSPFVHTHNAQALPVFIGDTGSAGVQGLVPQPPAGSGAAHQVLFANGNWGGLQGTLGGPLLGGGNNIGGVNLAGYTEQYVTLGNATGGLTVSFTAGTYQFVTLTGNTQVTFSGLPSPGANAAGLVLLVKQDATGGRTITFPGVRWGNATAPVATAAANGICIFSFISGIDGTNAVYGFTASLAAG